MVIIFLSWCTKELFFADIFRLVALWVLTGLINLITFESIHDIFSLQGSYIELKNPKPILLYTWDFSSTRRYNYQTNLHLSLKCHDWAKYSCFYFATRPGILYEYIWKHLCWPHFRWHIQWGSFHRDLRGWNCAGPLLEKNSNHSHHRIMHSLASSIALFPPSIWRERFCIA